MSSIASLIRQIAQQGQRPTIIVGQVTARDDEARTIDVQPSDGSAPLLGVALQSSTEGTTGIVTYPAIGSTVAVAMLTGYDAGFCFMTDEVDKIVADVPDHHLEMTADGINISGGGIITIKSSNHIRLNGTGNGGLINIKALMDTLKIISENLHTIKEGIEWHTHASVVGTVSRTTTTVDITDFSYLRGDYEDGGVMH